MWSLFLATFPLPPIVCLVVCLFFSPENFQIFQRKTEDSAKSHSMGLLREMQKIHAFPSTCSNAEEQGQLYSFTKPEAETYDN